MRRYQKAQRSFENVEGEDAEFLRQFAFICMLSYDVYIKKLMIEKIVDEMRGKKPARKPDKKEQKEAKNKE